MHEFSILASASSSSSSSSPFPFEGNWAYTVLKKSRLTGTVLQKNRQLIFMNNQYIQYPLKRPLKPPESISAFRFMVSNTSRVFTMFWFSANCKLCLTHGHDFSKTTYPAVRNSSCFFLQNFHFSEPAELSV